MFSRFFIHRPVFATVISIIIVIAGSICLYLSPVEEYPQLSPPQVVVTATYQGADAQTVANSVATVLEDAINGVEDMIYMQSTSSSSGMMFLSVYFDVGTDPQTAMVNVSNRVKAVEALLPVEVQRLGVNVSQRSSTILEVLAFYDPTGNMDPLELSNYVGINVVDELQRVPGVGSAMAIGQKEYSMRIWLKPDLLNHYGITSAEVIGAIREQNSQYSAGKLGEEPTKSENAFVLSLRPEGRLTSAKEFQQIILRSLPDGSSLRLKDVADVELGSAIDSFKGKIDGYEMTPVLIFLQNNANALSTARAVSSKLEELSKSFPDGLAYSIPYNTTDFVKIAVKEVVKTLIEAILLVSLVMYLFLGNIRATTIPMLAVPVSLIGSFIGLHLLGFSINLITLFAMILAIGIVVDDAIIVIENVERILEEDSKISVKEATIKAMSEIFSPIISIVLVLSAVFIPVSFMEGFVGTIQRQFALTLVVAVSISGFVALTLTPALCATMLKRERKEHWLIVRKFNEFFDFSTKVFTAGVANVIRHISISLGVVALLLLLTFLFFTRVPGGLVPPEDKGSLIAITTLPSSATLNRTEDNIDKIAAIVKSDKNIQNVSSMIGFDMFSNSLKENAAISFIKTTPWDERVTKESSSFALANKFNAILYGDRDSQSFVMNPPPIMGLSLTGGFELFAQSLTGKSYEEMQADMARIAMVANQRKELTMVRTTLNTTFPQYDMKVDRQKAKALGVRVDDIYTTIGTNIGTVYVNDFNMIGKTFKVYVRAKDGYRNSPDNLKNIYVRSRSGELISIDSFVTLTRDIGPDSVDRFNGFRAAKIMGEPRPGYTSAEAIAAISDVIKSEFKDEYGIGWLGSAYQEVHSQGTGTIAFIFGLVFAYLILAAQYERWLMPLVILTAVPFSVLGAIFFVWARGLNNDIYFQIGLILLIGLAAKNAILIVEFAMNEKAKGDSPARAALKASKLRFRPIVMTSLAFALGVLPMVLSTGAGAASRHALGTGVVGGMIFASTIAIFFIPLFYFLMENFNTWLDKKRRKV